MSAYVLSLGNPREASPKSLIIHAWLVENRDGLSLVMQADDETDQQVVDLKIEDGKARIVSRDLFATRLCRSLGVEIGAAVPVDVESASAPDETGEVA